MTAKEEDCKSQSVETQDHVPYHWLFGPQHSLVVGLPDLQLILTLLHLLEVYLRFIFLPRSKKLAKVLRVVGHQNIDKSRKRSYSFDPVDVEV